MFNLDDAKKIKIKQEALLLKEEFVYQMSIRLGIDPDAIDFESNISLPEQSSELYPASVILFNAIEDVKRLRGI